MSAHVPDRFDLLDEAKRATAPSVRAELYHRAQDGFTSVTDIPSALLRVMWWRKSIVRDGESYEDFHKRAVAQRSGA